MLGTFVTLTPATVVLGTQSIPIEGDNATALAQREAPLLAICGLTSMVSGST